ncbi:MAG: pantoate--beta-alanine ligase [Myxococcota bacterium]
MEIVTEPEAMQAWAREHRRPDVTIGFVPTMGFLHAGHRSLMDALRPRVDHLVVSIYVNPLQFGPNEDLDRYPRDPEGDAALCTEAGADVLFMPTSLYPSGFATSVSVHGLTEGLCGASRPGHFEGVATVCARLFGLTGCTHAAFGEKDFQQLAVIRRMVTDLAIDLQIVGCPLIRDDHGLALSSRNKYLSDADRNRAQTLSRALFAIQDAANDPRDVSRLRALGAGMIDSDRLEYFEIVDAASLEPLAKLTSGRPARALVAAHYGQTRLIDNVAVEVG